MPAAEYSKLFVVVFGIGVVFFGLICIIVLTSIMGKIMVALTKNQPAAPVPAAAPVAAPAAAPAPVGIAPEVIAAITAALSEEPGISSHGINITSIKKV
ncbi:MAG: OadG family protein [Oscillospiraceae bacterium]|nr:OadG family protein [Oscillospiraceae bacterium]